jgi:hypothetical protein
MPSRKNEHARGDLGVLNDIVERRAKILTASFALLEALETRRLNPSDEKISNLLIGASFSFWRAAFLLDTKRGSGQISADGKKFLETVLGDNAVSYGTDRNLRAWSVGYYLNNARYRLRSVAKYPGYAFARRGKKRPRKQTKF